MRTAAVLLIALSLAACSRGTHSNEAVRQGVVDHLAKKGLNVKGMDVNIASVDFKGTQADAQVSIAPKGANPAQGMSMRYHLEQQGNQWVVVGSANEGGNPHGGAAMPPAGESPHGQAAPPPNGGGKMPSPEDLPPTKKK